MVTDKTNTIYISVLFLLQRLIMLLFYAFKLIIKLPTPKKRKDTILQVLLSVKIWLINSLTTNLHSLT